MNYTIHGRISAELCRDYLDPEAQAYLRLYAGNKALAARKDGDREVVQIVTKEDVGALGQDCLGREPLGVDGDFKIGIDDRQHPYHGGPLLAVLELPVTEEGLAQELVHSTTFWMIKAFTPQWHNRDIAPSYAWSYPQH